MKRRFLSVIVTVSIFILSVVPAFAAASDVKILEGESGEIYIENVDPRVSLNSATSEKYKTFPFATSQTYTSYQMLNEAEKELYDYFRYSEFGTIEYYKEYDYKKGPDYATFKSIDFSNIMYALSYDCPELFYLDGVGWGYSYYDTNGNNKFDSGDYLAYLDFYFSDIDTSVYPDIYSLNEQLWAKVKSFDFSSCKTRYQLIKAFHDKLCNIADYDTDFSNPREYDVIGCFIDGECVCQGYSEAFRLLCNYYHIPCTNPHGTANGGGHMWNAVQMDNGKWYLLDVTWDDQSSIYYDFFLVGTQTKDTYFGKKAFSVSHVEQFGNVSPVINYSTTSYASSPDSGFVNYTDNYRFDTSVKGVNLFISSPTEKEQVYFNGVCISRSTGYTFTYNGKNYVTCYMGDTNGDAFTDALDYSQAVNYVLSGSAVNSASRKAADICNDGVLDVLDLSLIERLVNSNISEINVK